MKRLQGNCSNRKSGYPQEISIHNQVQRTESSQKPAGVPAENRLREPSYWHGSSGRSKCTLAGSVASQNKHKKEYG